MYPQPRNLYELDFITDIFTKDPDNVTLKTEYNTLKSKLTSIIEKRKTDYYKELLQKNSNAREMWKVIDEIKGTTQDDTIKMIKNDSDTLVTDKRMLANEFNKTFCETSRKLAQNIRTDPQFKTNINMNIVNLTTLRSLVETETGLFQF
nr:unnamed protein product [Callosobruchus analis]